MKEQPAPMVMMAREHYAPYRWVQAPIAAIALWLISSPFTLGYQDPEMIVSDVVTGVVVLGLSVIALGKHRGLVSWINGVVGLWLLAAPLVFWAPEAAAYVNDTFAGVMLFVFGFLIPMGMEMKGPVIPEGWSYNPSSWPQRAPAIALAVVSFFLARYMAAFQLGYIDEAWDPFFGDGTFLVLTSDVSRAWPISDAGLGAMVYAIEGLMGFMGDRRRWRTMPWMVAAFGVVVIPLGIVSIALVIMQPLAVGAWCTFCLATAVLMLFMIPLTLDEVVAMVQFVAKERAQGRSVWRTFWLGGHAPDDLPAWPRTREEAWRPRGMLWGFTAPWTLWLATAIGVWLMFSPSVFGSTGAMADSSHLVGALVIVVSVIAMAEVGRIARFLNLPLAAWLVAAPWLLGGADLAAQLNAAAAGVAIALASLPLGRLRDHYGTFDRWVVWGPRARVRERHLRQWQGAAA